MRWSLENSPRGLRKRSEYNYSSAMGDLSVLKFSLILGIVLGLSVVVSTRLPQIL